MILSLPNFEILEAMREHRIVECGAGTGLWQRIMREYGLNSFGIDPHPRGPDVIKGSHRDLHRYADCLLLVVWPPDGTDLDEWVNAWGGKHFAFAGDSGRVKLPSGFVEQKRVLIPGGLKGGSTFRMGVIET